MAEWPAQVQPRVRAISLKRCASRWAACEAHLLGSGDGPRIAPDEWDVQMAEGCDGSLYRLLAFGPSKSRSDPASDEGLKALEEALDCRLYRGWPVCESEDVARVLTAVAVAEELWGSCSSTTSHLPSSSAAAADDDDDGEEKDGDLEDKSEDEMAKIANLSEAELWKRYRNWFFDWPRERAMQYIDFHCRHITLGEVGAALSHWNIIQDAYRDQVPLLVVFEDDARPKRCAFSRLREEIEILEKNDFAWDLIYIRASLYSKTAEEKLEVPGSSLYLARHRKVTDAYCLSRRGIAKIEKSNFAKHLIAFDEFLPSLHSEHPRKDVMLLPSIKSARGPEGTFVGLSFGDEVLSEMARVGSETNLSPCLLGDHGAELCEDEDEDDEEG